MVALLFAPALQTRAAPFDIAFLNAGSAVGTGAFSFPDALLSTPIVSSNDFTSFTLTVGGQTFGTGDFFRASFDTNAGAFVNEPYFRNIVAPITVANGPVGIPLELGVFGFYDGCTYYTVCPPGTTPVFRGFSAITYDASGTQTSATAFDTLPITPVAAAVPEPPSMPVLGVGLLAVAAISVRNRRRKLTAGRSKIAIS